MLVALLRANPERLHRRQHQPHQGRRRAGSARRAAGRSRPAGRSAPHRDGAEPGLQRIPPPPGRQRADLAAWPMPTARPRARCRPTSKIAMRPARRADKLKISQGVAPGRATEEQIVQARQARRTSARVAELSKNIEDMNKLQAGDGAAPSTAAPAPAPATPPQRRPPTASAPAAPAPAAPRPLPARRRADARPSRRDCRTAGSWPRPLASRAATACQRRPRHAAAAASPAPPLRRAPHACAGAAPAVAKPVKAPHRRRRPQRRASSPNCWRTR